MGYSSKDACPFLMKGTLKVYECEVFVEDVVDVLLKETRCNITMHEILPQRMCLFQKEYLYLETRNRELKRFQRSDMSMFLEIAEYMRLQPPIKMPELFENPQASVVSEQVIDEVKEEENVDETQKCRDVDWRENEIISTRITNQKQCESCWAIVATEIVQAIVRIRYKLTDFPARSAQQLINCDKSGKGDLKNNGCKGGNYLNSWGVQGDEGFLSPYASEEEFPYLGRDEVCVEDISSPIKVTASGVLNIDMQGTRATKYVGTDLEICIALQSNPLAIIINDRALRRHGLGSTILSNEDYLQDEEDDKTCSEHINHAVTLVGYSSGDAESGPYWIIKNSWDADWALNGFAHFKANISDRSVEKDKYGCYGTFSMRRFVAFPVKVHMHPAPKYHEEYQATESEMNQDREYPSHASASSPEFLLCLILGYIMFIFRTRP